MSEEKTAEETETMDVDTPQNPSKILNADKKASNSHDELTQETGDAQTEKSGSAKVIHSLLCYYILKYLVEK